MAFSTQKDIFHVPFLNERPREKCISIDGVKLKTYASTTDERAWSFSKEKQSQYLTDLVACRMYANATNEAGDGPKQSARPQDVRSADNSEQREKSDRRFFTESKENLTPSIGDDSLIHMTIEKMSKFEELLAEKVDLKSQLEVSQERLKVYKEEKETIDAILNDHHSPDISGALEGKIKQLKSLSKIDKNDENELLKILDEQHNWEKAFKVRDAQNSYLRRLVEKLSLRSRLPNISVDPETSTDIDYLQGELNNLRKEVSLLRAIEEKQLSKENQGPANISDKDADNLAKIIAERNALREKCRQFNAYEGRILQWKHDSEQLQSSCCSLKKKDEEIEDCHDKIEELQYKINKMQNCSKMNGQSMCAAINCLKEENYQLKTEICSYNSEMKQIPALQSQIQCLNEELCRQNCIIDQYDMQFQQLLGVINDLQGKASVDIRSLQDVDSQTHNEQIEELAASTRATLDHISKEFEERQNLESDLAQSKAELEVVRHESQEKLALTNAELTAKELENSNLKKNIERTSRTIKESYHELDLESPRDEDCAAQVEQLKRVIVDLKSQLEAESLKKEESIEKYHHEAESLKKSLTKAHDEKQQLDNQNAELNKALSDCHDQLKVQKGQLSKLDQKASILESELSSSKADLKEVGKLVTDISSVQQRNEGLKSVVEAIDYSEVSSLKQQLEEEKTKGRYLTKQNEQLQTALDQAKNVINSQKAANNDPAPATSDRLEAIEETASRLSGAVATESDKESKPSVRKSTAKLGQSRKMHEAQRKIERGKYEKEIDGHRISNEVLRNSLTKLTTQMQTKSAADFEKEFRSILDNFIHEICMWRCDKRCKKLSKLEEICKKIIEIGIEHLTYKELVYLHQQMSDAAYKLRPKSMSSARNTGLELKCCKCSGDLCPVPTGPKESDRILAKLAQLERDIKISRSSLRKMKEVRNNGCSIDTERTELETIRPNTYRQNQELRNV